MRSCIVCGGSLSALLPPQARACSMACSTARRAERERVRLTERSVQRRTQRHEDVVLREREAMYQRTYRSRKRRRALMARIWADMQLLDSSERSELLTRLAANPS